MIANQKCGWCRARLFYVIGYGYSHTDRAGGAYVQKSVPCHNPSAGRQCVGDACRRCGGSGQILVDDHCAMPVPA